MLEDGLDPAEFFKIARSKPKDRRVRKKKRRKMVAQGSSYGKKKKEILEIKSAPRAEFLIPGGDQKCLHGNRCTLKGSCSLCPLIIWSPFLGCFYLWDFVRYFPYNLIHMILYQRIGTKLKQICNKWTFVQTHESFVFFSIVHPQPPPPKKM